VVTSMHDLSFSATAEKVVGVLLAMTVVVALLG
jgi:hypothetical protein